MTKKNEKRSKCRQYAHLIKWLKESQEKEGFYIKVNFLVSKTRRDKTVILYGGNSRYKITNIVIDVFTNLLKKEQK